MSRKGAESLIKVDTLILAEGGPGGQYDRW